MPLPDPNNTYIKPPSENQILEFIKTLGYDEDPKTKMIAISKMVATRLHQPWRAILSILWGIVHSANLDFASLIWDEFEWQTVKRPSRPSKMSKLLYTHFTKLIINYILSHNKSIPCESDFKLHSSQDDHPITKLLSTTNCDYKFGMEIPDAMISDAIKKKPGYTYYMAKKMESEKAKIVDEPEEQHISPVKSGRGKGFMFYGDQVASVPNKLKKYDVPRKTRSLTIAEEAVVGKLSISISIQELPSQRRRRSQLKIDNQIDKAVADMYNEWGQKLKGPTVEDLVVQSLLDLRKRSKANRLKSLRQKKQPVVGKGSNESKESANETDDVDESNMDLSDDNLHGNDNDARRFDDKKYEFRYVDLPRLSVNDVKDMYLLQVQDKLHHLPLEFVKDFNHALLMFIRRTVIKNRVEDIQLEVERYQRTLNLTKPTMFFKGIDQRIPFTMTTTHKEVVYLNQYKIKSLKKLSEVKKFYDGTLVKIENLIDMLSKNKLGIGNKRLNGRD
uniref:Uncharacterized protein n=1 Tax=Tanacetum cinerariifolium TaxID=118510 RepID=A0A699HQP7_TANCI|nr:hypothetical protein [Tanacetum cinerariifolium]